MKTNNDVLHGGKLKPEYFQTWADYYVEYIEAYKKEGIPIWGLTVQNEAMAVQVWVQGQAVKCPAPAQALITVVL
jgi:glucosylceramidase